MVEALATPEILERANAAVAYITSMEESRGAFVLLPSEMGFVTKCEQSLRASQLSEADMRKLEGIAAAIRTLWDGPAPALTVEHGPVRGAAPGHELTGAKRLGYVVQKRRMRP